MNRHPGFILIRKAGHRVCDLNKKPYIFRSEYEAEDFAEKAYYLKYDYTIVPAWEIECEKLHKEIDWLKSCLADKDAVRKFLINALEELDK